MAENKGALRVTALVSLVPRSVLQMPIPWRQGLSVLKALQDLTLIEPALGGQAQLLQKIEKGELYTSVWGRRVSLDTVLRANDRLELTRALRVDPKIARRERFQKQGSRGTGLFALKRKPPATVQDGS